jgi:predicted DNA-binding transcriptional regulator AlpA
MHALTTDEILGIDPPPGKTAKTEAFLIDERRAAKLLAISPITLRAWRLSGKGPRHVKLGVAVRYRRSDVIAFAEQRLVG